MQKQWNLERTKEVKEFTSCLHSHTSKSHFLVDLDADFVAHQTCGPSGAKWKCLSFDAEISFSLTSAEAIWGLKQTTRDFSPGFMALAHSCRHINRWLPVNIYNSSSSQPQPNLSCVNHIFYFFSKLQKRNVFILLFSNSLVHFIWFLWWLANGFQVPD